MTTSAKLEEVIRDQEGTLKICRMLLAEAERDSDIDRIEAAQRSLARHEGRLANLRFDLACLRAHEEALEADTDLAQRARDAGAI